MSEKKNKRPSVEIKAYWDKAEWYKFIHLVYNFCRDYKDEILNNEEHPSFKEVTGIDLYSFHASTGFERFDNEIEKLPSDLRHRYLKQELTRIEEELKTTRMFINSLKVRGNIDRLRDLEWNPVTHVVIGRQDLVLEHTISKVPEYILALEQIEQYAIQFINFIIEIGEHYQFELESTEVLNSFEDVSPLKNDTQRVMLFHKLGIIEHLETTFRGKRGASGSRALARVLCALMGNDVSPNSVARYIVSAKKQDPKFYATEEEVNQKIKELELN